MAREERIGLRMHLDALIQGCAEPTWLVRTKGLKVRNRKHSGTAGRSNMVSIAVKSGLLMGFGAAFVVVGAVMVVYWPTIFFTQLQKMMMLTETSTSFSIWREVPIPMYLECYMFNITNVDEILAGKNVTLKVEQLGPYVYREHHTKEDITWNDNNTVTFYNRRVWHFQPDMSNGSISDNITSINPIIATVGHIMRNEPLFLRVAVNVFMGMNHKNLFLTANVSSWLFDGISDPLFDIAAQFPDLPFEIPFDKFGWFYSRNESKEFDGVFVMNTGTADFSQLGNVEMWRHSNRTMYRDHCGEVRGSTGELWAPELGQEELVVFSSDLCTYLTLSKSGPLTVDGIEGMQYSTNDSTFDNGHKYPSMACYCDEVRDENCLPSGALNVSACRFGSPAFVTLPHFLGVDSYYADKIEGLAPTDDYKFRLALEMYTGMPLQVFAQLQINLLVRYVPGISLNNQLPDGDTLVPMFWFRQEVRINDEYARLARFALNLRDGMPYGFYALTAIGIILLIVGIVYLMRKLLKSPETAPILNETNNTEETR
ncbi:Protein croquemort [Papilio machaon]|uniref:Protein croquemort n=1 Tax=Papilio machaon TaxID=76193 RepID=A0A194QMT9_PAPMA|nr:Protein croquemort [Papilio machaon]